jgi:hypothetical protein
VIWVAVDVKITRVLIVLAIGGGGIYAFFMGGIVYVMAFIIALLAWTLREAVWWRGSGHRGGFIRSFWGPDWKDQRTKKDTGRRS